MSRKSLAVFVTTPFLLRHEYVNEWRMRDITQPESAILLLNIK